MKIIKVDGRLPLFLQYPTQSYPQDAYIELDCDAETLSADYNAEIGNAVPFDVWHGRVLRFPVNCRLSAAKVNKLMKTIEPLALRVIDGYEKRWDGHSHIGRFTEDGQHAKEEIFDLVNPE